MATSHKYQQSFTKWSFGAELEFVDWPRNADLPGLAIDEGNYTSVNSNGIAVDGKGKTYHLGGEILTAPSENIEGPSNQMQALQQRWPQMTHNYRTGLNTHVRVPGLRDDLKKLKQLQKFIHRVMPELLPVIDPILLPSEYQYFGGDYKGAMKNFKTRQRDHWTLLSPERLKLQLSARSPREFFEAEVIDETTGKLHWAIRPRTCVNLRQMLQTDSIEFRHFFMPYTPAELLDTMRWSKYFLEAAFDGSDVSAQQLLDGFKLKTRWPPCLPYDPWLDRGFHFTSPHVQPPFKIAGNIQQWLVNEAQEIKKRKAEHVGNYEAQQQALSKGRR